MGGVSRLLHASSKDALCVWPDKREAKGWPTTSAIVTICTYDPVWRHAACRQSGSRSTLGREQIGGL